MREEKGKGMQTGWVQWGRDALERQTQRGFTRVTRDDTNEFEKRMYFMLDAERQEVSVLLEKTGDGAGVFELGDLRVRAVVSHMPTLLLLRTKTHAIPVTGQVVRWWQWGGLRGLFWGRVRVVLFFGGRVAEYEKALAKFELANGKMSDDARTSVHELCTELREKACVPDELAHFAKKIQDAVRIGMQVQSER